MVCMSCLLLRVCWVCVWLIFSLMVVGVMVLVLVLVRFR